MARKIREEVERRQKAEEEARKWVILNLILNLKMH